MQGRNIDISTTPVPNKIVCRLPQHELISIPGSPRRTHTDNPRVSFPSRARVHTSIIYKHIQQIARSGRGPPFTPRPLLNDAALSSLLGNLDLLGLARFRFARRLRLSHLHLNGLGCRHFRASVLLHSNVRGSRGRSVALTSGLRGLRMRDGGTGGHDHVLLHNRPIAAVGRVSGGGRGNGFAGFGFVGVGNGHFGSRDGRVANDEVGLLAEFAVLLERVLVAVSAGEERNNIIIIAMILIVFLYLY